MTDMKSPIVYFIAFVVFIFCQYSIWVTSNLVAHHFQLTGSVYWCVVCVAFLLLNEFCFGAYEFGFGGDDRLDELIDDWDGE